jgi:hypothetical protein
MGQCDLCGQSAGLFKSRHPACNANAESLKNDLRNLVFEFTLDEKPFAEINARVQEKVQENKLPGAYFKESVLQFANDAVSQIALKSPISSDELTRLVDILKGFGFPEQDREKIMQRRLYGMAFSGMSNTLWEVQNDRPPYYDGTGRTQFNLQHGEAPIISVGKVTFAEERTINTGSRTYGGLSLPIGAGAYYHIGASQGHKVSGLLPLDEGEMLVTSQALYFGGQTRTLRISLASVLRYQTYVDGVGVCEASGPPKVFVPDYSGMDTGWFFFNLLSILTSKLSR